MSAQPLRRVPQPPPPARHVGQPTAGPRAGRPTPATHPYSAPPGPPQSAPPSTVPPPTVATAPPAIPRLPLATPRRILPAHGATQSAHDASRSSPGATGPAQVPTPPRPRTPPPGPGSTPSPPMPGRPPSPATRPHPGPFPATGSIPTQRGALPPGQAPPRGPHPERRSAAGRRTAAVRSAARERSAVPADPATARTVAAPAHTARDHWHRPTRRPDGGRRAQPQPAGPVRPRAVRLAGAVPGLIRHLPHHKPWMVALVLHRHRRGPGDLWARRRICWSRTTAGRRRGTHAERRRSPSGISPVARPIPRLLTVADVFPDAEIIADPAVPAVQDGSAQAQVLDGLPARPRRAMSASCCRASAATRSSGRRSRRPTAATSSPPGSSTWWTAAAVQGPRTTIKSLVVTPRRVGSPATSSGTSGAGARPRPHPAAWDAQGHFLVYCVIARADGKEFADDDPHVKCHRVRPGREVPAGPRIVDWAIDRAPRAVGRTQRSAFERPAPPDSRPPG